MVSAVSLSLSHWYPGSGVVLDCIFLCYLCFMLVMFSCLFIAALLQETLLRTYLWSPDEKGLASWLSYYVISCVFVTFPCGALGQVWYSIGDFSSSVR